MADNGASSAVGAESRVSSGAAMAAEVMVARPRAVPGAASMIVLEPVSHPELKPIRIGDTLFAIGRSEAPFDAYPSEIAGDLSRRHARIFRYLHGELREIRQERRPDSRYANLENCRYEVDQAEKLMRREGIRWINSTAKSIEEIATTILRELKIERHVY